MDARDDGIGGRVAEQRKLKGLTQAQLSQRAHVSLSLVRKVEQGSVPASPGFTAAVAKVLGTTVAELYEQPSPRFGNERVHVAELETAVIEGADAVLDRPIPDLDLLAAEVVWIARLQRHSRYEESSAVLPGLLRILHAAASDAASGETSERLHHLLAQTYSCALYCLHRLGSTLTGWAAQRGAAAAGFSGDALLAAVAAASPAVALLHRGSYTAGRRVVDQAYESISDHPDTASAQAVRGSMHLQNAILAARSGHRSDSDDHLDQARDLARFVPPVDYEQTDYYDTAFSATNVEFHAIAAAVELGDPTTAVARGAELQIPPTIMRSRLGHHHIDMAGACLLHGDRERVLHHLNAARRITPQQTRYHPMVHETVRTLTRTERRRSDTVAGFARWAGIGA